MKPASNTPPHSGHFTTSVMAFFSRFVASGFFWEVLAYERVQRQKFLTHHS
jgi:hypothetical protein